MISPRRGEIYDVTFVAVGPREIPGPRPALVVQNDVANRMSRLTIVAAITTNLRLADLPAGVRVSPEESGLPRHSVIHHSSLKMGEVEEGRRRERRAARSN
jgi:mRNA interferase MazF